jgi:hypothetical protein
VAWAFSSPHCQSCVFSSSQRGPWDHGWGGDVPGWWRHQPQLHVREIIPTRETSMVHQRETGKSGLTLVPWLVAHGNCVKMWLRVQTNSQSTLLLLHILFTPACLPVGATALGEPRPPLQPVSTWCCISEQNYFLQDLLRLCRGYVQPSFFFQFIIYQSYKYPTLAVP